MKEEAMTGPVTPARRLRRITGGVALVLFPALLVVQGPIDPTTSGIEALYTSATRHPNALAASALLLLVSGMLMAPAAAAILHQARDRGAALANIGAVLAVLGGFGHAGIALLQIFGSALAGGDRSQMLAYVERINESSLVGWVAFPLILCFGLGLVVLAWAAWRSGVVGLWGPVAATAVVLAHLVLPEGIPALEVIALLVLLVVFGYLGIRVLRMTDAEWDGVPAATRVTVGAA
jgi:hypothetical protein